MDLVLKKTFSLEVNFKISRTEFMSLKFLVIGKCIQGLFRVNATLLIFDKKL